MSHLTPQPFRPIKTLFLLQKTATRASTRTSWVRDKYVRAYQHETVSGPAGGRLHQPLTLRASTLSPIMETGSSSLKRSLHTIAPSSSTDLSRDFAELSRLFPSDPSLWYVLTSITLVCVGRQHLIANLWEYLAALGGSYHSPIQDSEGDLQGDQPLNQLQPTNDDSEKIQYLIQAARELREGLMKMSVLFGYPRAINSLKTLLEAQRRLAESTSNPIAHLHATFLSCLQDTPSTRTHFLNEYSSTNNYCRGLSLFIKIYTSRHAAPLLKSMAVTSSGDLAYYAVSRLYGDLLGDLSVLGGKQTGLACFVTCLALALAAGPEEVGLEGQVKGHMYGSKNLGASEDEVRGAADLVVRIWEAQTAGRWQDVPESLKVLLDKLKGW